MRGPLDSKVVLTLRRAGGDPFELTLIRAKILTQSVHSHLENGDIGYVRITTFNEHTDAKLAAAMQNLKEQVAGTLVGIILDLRNNAGGLLDQALAVADEFLDAGEIIAIQGSHSTKRYSAHPGDISGGLPLIVMINHGTASGAEIVAAAMQDNRRAVLLGTRSHGTGSVQTIIPLSGHGAMRLTTALDVTPSGRLIQGMGITPDKIVQASEAGDPTTPVALGSAEDRQFTAAVDLIGMLVQRN